MFGFFKKKPEAPAQQETPPPPLQAGQPPQPSNLGFHTNQDLIPETELEQVLADAKQRKVSVEDAMNFLFRSEASVLDTDFDRDHPNKLHNPLRQFGPNDEPLIALFSSPKRAEPLRQRRPEFRYLKTVEVASLIRALAPGIGLVLNPGWKVGVQLPPQEIDRIKSCLTPTPPPLPPDPSTASGSRDAKFPEGFSSEMRRELEPIGAGSEDDVLTAGIGMIKMGARELLPGWLSQFGKTQVYSVGIDNEAPESAFVFGPPEDRTYLAVFTRRSLADECIAEMPLLKFVIPIQGVSILTLAMKRELGVWINPLSDACSFRVPSNMVGRFLEEANRP